MLLSRAALAVGRVGLQLIAGLVCSRTMDNSRHFQLMPLAIQFALASPYHTRSLLSSPSSARWGSKRLIRLLRPEAVHPLLSLPPRRRLDCVREATTLRFSETVRPERLNRCSNTVRLRGLPCTMLAVAAVCGPSHGDLPSAACALLSSAACALLSAMGLRTVSVA